MTVIPAILETTSEIASFRRGVVAPSFTTTPAWFDCWQDAYLDADERAVTVAGVPMVADTGVVGPLRYARLRSQTNPHSPRFDALDGAAPGADFLARALAEGADFVRLDYLAEGSALLAAARRWPGARIGIAPHALSPVIDCTQSYDAWLAKRSKRHAGRWRKLEQQLVGQHGARLQLLDRAADLDRVLGEMFALEQRGWKGRERTAILDSAADTRFYTRVAHAAAAAGALRLALLSIDDRLIAFEYGVLGGDELYLLKVGYDEAYEDLSVGHVLARMHIRAACADPAIRTYDKLGNGMTPAPYKLRFADRLEPLYRVAVYAPTMRGEMVRRFHEARAQAKHLRDRWRARRAQRDTATPHAAAA